MKILSRILCIIALLTTFVNIAVPLGAMGASLPPATLPSLGAKVFAPQYQSYTAYGTSLTAGCCASTTAKNFVSLIGAQLGVPPVNNGISGSEMADQEPGIYAQAVSDTASQLFTLDVGKNEGAFYGTASNRISTFQAMHQASLAWLATPARNKVVGQAVAASVSVSSVVFNGAGSNPNYGSATVTTTAPHGFATGQPVTLTGASPSAYNVTAPITVIDATHFSIPVAASPAPSSPATGTITATGPGITYAGTWNADTTYFGGAMSEHSATNGSTATFTSYGATMYLAYGMATGNGGTATVSVDGTVYATITTNGVSGGFATTNQSTAHGSGLLRMTGFSAAQHTIVVTVTSTTASGNDVWIDWVSGKGNPGASAYYGGPTVVAMGSPQGGNGSYADAAYVAAAFQDVGVVAGDGLNVVYADVPGNINPGTDIQPDNVHYNDLGEVHATEAVMAALNTASTGRGKSAFLAASNNPFLGPILSGAAYGNYIINSGLGNNILGGGFGGANYMNGSGNNNIVVCGSSNHIGGGGTSNTNNNFLGCGSQNTIQFGGSNVLGGGSLNTVQGFYNFLGGGQNNQVFGTYSGIASGYLGTDRTRYGWQGFGSGSFSGTPGTAQTGTQLARGTGTVGSATVTVPVTADAGTAGSANTDNLTANGLHYHVEVTGSCTDSSTTSHVWASWDGNDWGDADRKNNSLTWTGAWSSATAAVRYDGSSNWNGATMQVQGNVSYGLTASFVIPAAATPTAAGDAPHCMATYRNVQEVQ